MTTFLRLLGDTDKATSLLASCTAIRTGAADERHFHVLPESFRVVPGAPFAYWVSEAVRLSFANIGSLEKQSHATSGTGTLDDFRFLRLWFEVVKSNDYFPYAKGGAYSRIYYDQHLTVNWGRNGLEMKAWIVHKYGGGHWGRNIRSPEYYFRPGLTWPRRTQGGLSFRAMPRGCIFGDKGPAAFALDDCSDALLSLLALVNSQPFKLLVSLQMAFGSYEVGVIQRTPVPDLASEQGRRLAALANRAWSLKRCVDTQVETSHAFLLPAALLARLTDYDPYRIERELAQIQAKIDAIAFNLYGFSDIDRNAVEVSNSTSRDEEGATENDDEGDDNEIDLEIDKSDGLLSWAVGVAFGRLDWRLATGERAVPPEPDPFDPLPELSTGMLPNGADPFHRNAGILVDAPGNKQDLTQLIQDVLIRVNAPVSLDVRRWLQREFFTLHLQQYSKSRRKAPIYWPLATASGGYTLWLYYPDINSETLFTAINNFIEPKLEQVCTEASVLRNKGSARSRDGDRQLETLQTLEKELIELRDSLLQIAPTYRPNHDDGVQITAAPLWPLFRHKPWQKLLRETWERLKKGDYDWSHLAIIYWPDRVCEKCKTDKSLAIAHGLEALYEPPPDSTAGLGSGVRKRRGVAP